MMGLQWKIEVHSLHFSSDRETVVFRDTDIIPEFQTVANPYTFKTSDEVSASSAIFLTRKGMHGIGRE